MILIPYPSFYDSCECLESDLLREGEVEALQVINFNSGRSDMAVEHYEFWRGYEASLSTLLLYMDTELRCRGEAETEFTQRVLRAWNYYHQPRRAPKKPPFLDDPDFFLRVQEYLVWMNLEYYGEKFPHIDYEIFNPPEVWS